MPEKVELYILAKYLSRFAKSDCIFNQANYFNIWEKHFV